MMIYTAKLNKKLLFSILAVIVIVVLALIFGLPGQNESQTTMGEVKIKTEEDVLAFIKGLGYEIKEGTLTSREVTIPKEFDETYEKYNEMQKSCGFDLGKHKGKTVTLYTADVTNHPESENTVIEVLVYKKKVIGGSVYTKNLDGFMYGLEEMKKEN